MINPPLEIQLIFIIFGLLVGSFLNVVIHRIPLHLSVVKPRSSCPKCKNAITWYQNIPLISFLALKGKCAHCKVKIPIRYFLVELLMGTFAYLLIPQNISFISIFYFLYYFFTAAVFVTHFLIDIEYQILPDRINLFFLFITLIFVILTKPFMGWFIGGVIGFVIPYGVTYIFYKIRGVIGLGGGDIKLFGILGLILGPIGIIQNMFFSCALGAVFGLILILLKKMKPNNPMAFGPFIILSAAVQIFLPSIFKIINPFLVN